jgi:hypothetical protein
MQNVLSRSYGPPFDHRPGITKGGVMKISVNSAAVPAGISKGA